jgi:hypothetical protein
MDACALEFAVYDLESDNPHYANREAYEGKPLDTYGSSYRDSLFTLLDEEYWPEDELDPAEVQDGVMPRLVMSQLLAARERAAKGDVLLGPFALKCDAFALWELVVRERLSDPEGESAEDSD